MERTIYQDLLAWKADAKRKCLILQGARQVGKTHILKHFAEQAYRDSVCINFEEQPDAAIIFDGELDPKKLINKIQIFTQQDVTQGETLIILDEIQACPNALTSLKYFTEKAPEYHVAVAGSLLGVTLSKSKGFPVGKVDFLHLYPMTFFEFLDAMNEHRLREHVQAVDKAEPINEAFHMRLLELLRTYYFTGGMPEAVAEYCDTQNVKRVRKIQQSILNAYLRDFSKHAPPNEVMNIIEVWETAPKILAKENKKFVFAEINDQARRREYSTAVQWLKSANLLHQSSNVTNPKLPIEVYSNQHTFKLFMLDVGLLACRLRMSPELLLKPTKIFSDYEGAFTENFIAQELVAHHDLPLYYWTNPGKAEVDFLMEVDGKIYPLEVKAGRGKIRSLRAYQAAYGNTIISKTSPGNLKQDDDVINYPLYLIALFPHLSSSC